MSIYIYIHILEFDYLEGSKWKCDGNVIPTIARTTPFLWGYDWNGIVSKPEYVHVYIYIFMYTFRVYLYRVVDILLYIGMLLYWR